jgi:hypothetical protein
MNIGKQRVTRTNKIGFLSLPVTGHLNPMTALARKLQYRLIRHPDRKTRELAAEAWCKREDGHVSLNPQAKPNARFADPDFRMMFATLVIHYWANAAFLGGQEILQNMGRIVHLPGVLIHGRLDVSSPIANRVAIAPKLE